MPFYANKKDINATSGFMFWKLFKKLITYAFCKCVENIIIRHDLCMGGCNDVSIVAIMPLFIGACNKFYRRIENEID